MTTPSAAVPPAILARRGATRTADVPAEVRRFLDAGLIETVNLCEWLVVDQGALAAAVLPAMGWRELVRRVQRALAGPGITTAPRRLEAAGTVLAEACADTAACDGLLAALTSHTSDTVRCWAAWLIAKHPAFRFPDKLSRLRPLAADANMGVREIAWMALRPDIAADVPQALRRLLPLTKERDANLRRFASEATRPRGVWCRHLDALKRDPAPGLPLLEPLRADPAKYVRDSVANWLNDASKSCPDWVREVCARWEAESPVPETAAIVRRALRTLRKAGA